MKSGANKWQEIDNYIKDGLVQQVSQVSASEQMKWKIDQSIRNDEIREVSKMRNWSIKKKIGLAVIVGVLASTACLAGGAVTSIVSHGHPEWMRLAYEDIEKAEKDLGFEVQAVKTFNNGYTFKDLDIIEKEGMDDDGNVMERYKSADIQYIKENAPKVSLYIEKSKHHMENRTANETKQYKEVELSYYLSHYKFVPEDYELTEEDKANLEREDYEISYGFDAGSNKIEEKGIHSVCWEIGDVSYNLMVFDTDMTTAELFDMVEEIIDVQ